MLPMWASYIVKAYAWTLLLAKDGVAQWFLQHLGLEPLLLRSLHYLRWAEIRCQLPGWGAFWCFSISGCRS